MTARLKHRPDRPNGLQLRAGEGVPFLGAAGDVICGSIQYAGRRFTAGEFGGVGALGAGRRPESAAPWRAVRGGGVAAAAGRGRHRSGRVIVLSISTESECRWGPVVAEHLVALRVRAPHLQ